MGFRLTFVACLFISGILGTAFVEGAPTAPYEPASLPDASETRPPLGHTISLPRRLPLRPEAVRPASITLTARPQSMPVGQKVALAARVTDQFGDPVPDGARIDFLAGSGTLSASRARTQRGRATVELTGTTEGPVRVVASAGFLQAVAFVHFRRAGAVAGSVVIDEDFSTTPGCGRIENGTFVLNSGIALKGDAKGAQGLVYDLDGLRAGAISFDVRDLGAAGRVEGFFCLMRQGKDGARSPVLDLRRGGKRGRERWSLRCFGDATGDDGGKAGATGEGPSLEGLSCRFEVTWQGTSVKVVCHDLQKKRLFEIAVPPLAAPLQPIHEVWLGGHPRLDGPKTVTIERVRIIGR